MLCRATSFKKLLCLAASFPVLLLATSFLELLLAASFTEQLSCGIVCGSPGSLQFERQSTTEFLLLRSLCGSFSRLKGTASNSSVLRFDGRTSVILSFFAVAYRGWSAVLRLRLPKGSNPREADRLKIPYFRTSVSAREIRDSRRHKNKFFLSDRVASDTLFSR